MAFDGITVRALKSELSDKLTGLRIVKIAQPESDELLLTLKGNSTQYRLLLSANASLPLVYITENNKQGPERAPGFCMLLRKHLSNARLLEITQPGFERVLLFKLEHLDEMGDLCRKYLIVELMGKYSNIIFTDEEFVIIDAIKRVSHNMSSVREVLSGRQWFIPGSDIKKNGSEVIFEEFKELISGAHAPVRKAIYTGFEGVSPTLASELCFRAGIDSDMSTSALSDADIKALWDKFSGFYREISEGTFAPEIVYDGRKPVEFGAFSLSMYGELKAVRFEGMSETLETFYRDKSLVVRIQQKSSDLRKITANCLERLVKKADLQKKQLEDTQKRDIYKVYGELINAYGYNVPEGAKSFEALNYYTNETITIPLDPMLSVKENGKKYFDKYVKLKRTAENLTEILKEVESETEHLKSVITSLDLCENEEDLSEIKEEMYRAGFIKSRPEGVNGRQKKRNESKPLHFVSSDGFEIYVGKNNFQNDRLTFEFANGNDWWFHAKHMHGSHVILKCGIGEIPDRAFEEAARYAALYSEGRDSSKVEVDYTLKKNVKKPAGANPGFVVYYTNYSMVVDLS
ncbi:MAG: NFACT family protein [Lachnospiraceae bacterium]|nr:NFACT family protein [Lachnospiraceae bacterium]